MSVESAWKELGLSNPHEVTAVELYPGLGTWTSAMINGGVKKVIALEPNITYREALKPLQSAFPETLDVLKDDGYDWDTYTELKQPKYIGSLAETDWSKVHPHLFFTGTMPKSTHGEQLLAQFITCIVNRMAMYTLGRIQWGLWLPTNLYKKLSAPPGSVARCKMSVAREACATVNVVYTAELDSMYPRNDYCLVHIVPFEQRRLKADWDVFEYVLKHLFVMQRQPLSKTIKTLGPGADILLKRLSFEPDLDVGQMTAEQIDEVAVKFDEWPLRPRILFEDESAII